MLNLLHRLLILILVFTFGGQMVIAQQKGFFGNLHSHTSYSDGQGAPKQPYTVAQDMTKKESGDHNHFYAPSVRTFRASYTIDTMPVVEVPITWTPRSAPHTIELRNFSARATPVVHLLVDNNRQIASAAAKGNQLMLSVDGKTSGAFTVVVRSQNATSLQTADLWVDSKLNTGKLQFSAGTAISMSGLSFNEQVLGIQAQLGPAVHVAYVLTQDGLQILGRNSGSHTLTRLSAPKDALVVFASLSGASSGPLRVYRNDADHDTDGDGLGDALEESLGTCASNLGSVAGVNCNELADSRDTDGDGLQDGWEVLGKLSTWSDNGVFKSEYLPLPTWGANPRHKDIFVEVDFRRLNLVENQTGLALHMPALVARQMAASYADTATTDFWLKARHALSVNNPDRLPGINLHLDTGVLPTDPADLTIFGDWGGYNPVNAVPVGNGGWMPQRPEQVWKQQMSQGRWGVFHYVMGYISGGGACGEGIACGFNMADAGNSAHEFGHTLGLNHNGPNGVHEPNCKPNYPSLMNYAYLNFGYRQFSDGLSYPGFNNHSLKETNAIDPANTALLNVLKSSFQYKVDPSVGSVDWNRDGTFAPAGSTVRAYANYQPGGSCEYTREGFQDSGLQSERSPAVVYFRNKILIFSVGGDGQVHFTFTTGPWTCSPTIDTCPTPVFASPLTLPIGSMLSVDAKPYRVGNNLEQIIVTGIRSDGSLIEIPVVLDSGGWPAWGTVTTISGPGTAIGELSLAVSQKKTAMAMVYKGPDNTVRFRRRSASGWSVEAPLMVGSQPIQMIPTASPGLAFTNLPIGLSLLMETLVGAFADTTGNIQLYRPAQLGPGWTRISIPYEAMYSPVGRPSIGWVGSPGGGVLASPGGASSVAASSTANRFYILYLEHQIPTGSPPPDAVRMAISYVDTAGKYRIGLNAYFDNVWSFAYGTGIVQPSDGALRVVVSSAVPNSLRRIHFRPHADGVSDLTYRNYDDWKTIGWGSCSTLAATQATSAVQCVPAW
jgi:hypothetical protein